MAQRPPGFETVSYSAALPEVTKDSWEVFAVRRRGRGDSQSCHAHTILKTIDNEEVATEQTSRLQAM
jgi:hypothetical protein